MGQEANSQADLAASRFADTHWSVVLAAAGTPSKEAAAALNALCRQYWYPLYAFVRRQGEEAVEAEDLVQSFFAMFLEKEYFRRADPERGRFRSFLLASLKHFLTNERHRRRAAKRGCGVAALPLDKVSPEEIYQREAAHPLTPDELYDRAWALAMLERARDRLQEDYAGRGHPERFLLLETFLPGQRSDLTYAEAGRQLGISEGAVKAEVHRLRQRYRACLRAVIIPTVSGLEGVESELRALTAALSP